MDLYNTIEQLHAERRHLDQVIQALETLREAPEDGATPTRRRISNRGRKSMGQEERRKVSERMRKYWQKRRNK